MTDNQSQTESILEIVRAIEIRSIVLPEFQRDFRWEMDKTFDLFDSLVRGIFIGSVIYGKPAFTISVRNLDLRPRRGKGSKATLAVYEINGDEAVEQSKTKNLRLLLDGQQRITSIVRALEGVDKVFFTVSEDADISHINSITLEDVFGSIEGVESADRLCVALHHAWVVERKAYDEEIRDLFDATHFCIKNKANWTTEEDKHYYRVYRRIVNQLIDLMKQQKLLSFYLLDMSLQKFCMFFERSNSRGIQLDFTDILAAKLYSGFNLRREIDIFAERFPERSLNKEVIIRTIAYLAAADEERGLVIDKDTILRNLEAAHFNKYWPEVVRLYDRSIRFLIENNFVISQSWMPTENMLVPIMIWLRTLKDFSQSSNIQSKFFNYWFWSSVFSNKYSTSSNEIIVADCRMLAQIASGQLDLRTDFFRRQRSSITEPTDFLTLVRSTNAVYKGTLNLVNYAAGGLPDWNNTHKITSGSRPEDHHIYPRGFLLNSDQVDMDDGSVDDFVDCVVNRTLMPKLTNIIVGKRAPREYLKDLLRQNEKLGLCLEQHLIDSAILDEQSWDNHFQAFLDDRAAKMFELVERHIVEPGKELQEQLVPDTLIDDVISRRRLNLEGMLREGILKVGDQLYVQKAQALTAELVDHDQVRFNSKQMRLIDWAKHVTRWPTVNIYDRVWSSRTGKKLEDMRRG